MLNHLLRSSYHQILIVLLSHTYKFRVVRPIFIFKSFQTLQQILFLLRFKFNLGVFGDQVSDS